MPDEFAMPPQTDAVHEVHMRRALELARQSLDEGSVPVGAVIVVDGRIVGEGRNIQAVSGDPLDHAETRALKDAVHRLGKQNLPGAVCYSTVESCPMCFWALQALGVDTIVLGATFQGMGRTDFGEYSIERLSALTGRPLNVIHNVLSKECADIRGAMKVR